MSNSIELNKGDTILSPFYPSPILLDNFTYPSPIDYILSLFSCNDDTKDMIISLKNNKRKYTVAQNVQKVCYANDAVNAYAEAYELRFKNNPEILTRLKGKIIFESDDPFLGIKDRYGENVIGRALEVARDKLFSDKIYHSLKEQITKEHGDIFAHYLEQHLLKNYICRMVKDGHTLQDIPDVSLGNLLNRYVNRKLKKKYEGKIFEEQKVAAYQAVKDQYPQFDDAQIESYIRYIVVNTLVKKKIQNIYKNTSEKHHFNEYYPAEAGFVQTLYHILINIIYRNQIPSIIERIKKDEIGPIYNLEYPLLKEQLYNDCLIEMDMDTMMMETDTYKVIRQTLTRVYVAYMEEKNRVGLMGNIDWKRGFRKYDEMKGQQDEDIEDEAEKAYKDPATNVILFNKMREEIVELFQSQPPLDKRILYKFISEYKDEISFLKHIIDLFMAQTYLGHMPQEDVKMMEDTATKVLELYKKKQLPREVIAKIDTYIAFLFDVPYTNREFIRHYIGRIPNVIQDIPLIIENHEPYVEYTTTSDRALMPTISLSDVSRFQTVQQYYLFKMYKLYVGGNDNDIFHKLFERGEDPNVLLSQEVENVFIQELKHRYNVVVDYLIKNNLEFTKALLLTHHANLIFTWDDPILGMKDGKGENYVGKKLVEVRDLMQYQIYWKEEFAKLPDMRFKYMTTAEITRELKDVVNIPKQENLPENEYKFKLLKFIINKKLEGQPVNIAKLTDRLVELGIRIPPQGDKSDDIYRYELIELIEEKEIREIPKLINKLLKLGVKIPHQENKSDQEYRMELLELIREHEKPKGVNIAKLIDRLVELGIRIPPQADKSDDEYRKKLLELIRESEEEEKFYEVEEYPIIEEVEDRYGKLSTVDIIMNIIERGLAFPKQGSKSNKEYRTELLQLIIKDEMEKREGEFYEVEEYKRPLPKKKKELPIIQAITIPELQKVLNEHNLKYPEQLPSQSDRDYLHQLILFHDVLNPKKLKKILNTLKQYIQQNHPEMEKEFEPTEKYANQFMLQLVMNNQPLEDILEEKYPKVVSPMIQQLQQEFRDLHLTPPQRDPYMDDEAYIRKLRTYLDVLKPYIPKEYPHLKKVSKRIPRISYSPKYDENLMFKSWIDNRIQDICETACCLYLLKKLIGVKEVTSDIVMDSAFHNVINNIYSPCYQIIDLAILDIELPHINTGYYDMVAQVLKDLTSKLEFRFNWSNEQVIRIAKALWNNINTFSFILTRGNDKTFDDFEKNIVHYREYLEEEINNSELGSVIGNAIVNVIRMCEQFVYLPNLTEDNIKYILFIMIGVDNGMMKVKDYPMIEVEEEMRGRLMVNGKLKGLYSRVYAILQRLKGEELRFNRLFSKLLFWEAKTE